MCLEKILSSNSDHDAISIKSFFFRNRKWKTFKSHTFKIAPTFSFNHVKMGPSYEQGASSRDGWRKWPQKKKAKSCQYTWQAVAENRREVTNLVLLEGLTTSRRKNQNVMKYYTGKWILTHNFERHKQWKTEMKFWSWSVWVTSRSCKNVRKVQVRFGWRKSDQTGKEQHCTKCWTECKYCKSDRIFCT